MVRFLFILLLTLITTFYVKNILYQMENYKKAQDLYNKGNIIESIDSYEKVILAYTPASKWTDLAVFNLYSICKNLDDTYEKLYCYETLNSSLNQIRPFNSYEELQSEVKKNIVDIKSDILNEKDKNLQQKLIQFDEFSSSFWTILSVISLYLWIGFVVMIIWNGFDDNYKFNLSKVKKYVIFTIIFYILWIIGLFMA